MQSIWEAFSANYRSCTEKRTLNATSPFTLIPAIDMDPPIPIEGGSSIVGRKKTINCFGALGGVAATAWCEDLWPTVSLLFWLLIRESRYGNLFSSETDEVFFSRRVMHGFPKKG
ncbi:hypothetical protein CDAR_113811 [Caerostris darwini]|uniref:Uncharacterized protein n=1 Tax=Caerostris darwini TaxID=1538125 RepID=A0AAV4UZX5_9ARAC|nr:hypothetical protein CDAR_113811 [Caerostris darwini]